MTALFPPSSSSDRPNRLPTATATLRPIADEPVAEIRGSRRSPVMASPMGWASPTHNENTPDRP